MARIRIILDTNWYISATINKKSRRTLYELITNESLLILFSEEILQEYKKVIARDKFNKIIRQAQVNRFMKLVMLAVHKVDIQTETFGSRDLKDNFLLSMAFDGNADYLVTGDLDLLVLRKIGQTQIVTLAQFLELIAQK